jgi:hypothetical protein
MPEKKVQENVCFIAWEKQYTGFSNVGMYFNHLIESKWVEGFTLLPQM